MIKMQKYYVTNGEIKARVWYSAGQLMDGTFAVTLYAKDYSRNLGKIFGSKYINNSDSMSDYFDEGKVIIRKGDPLFEAAMARAR